MAAKAVGAATAPETTVVVKAAPATAPRLETRRKAVLSHLGGSDSVLFLMLLTLQNAAQGLPLSFLQRILFPSQRIFLISSQEPQALVCICHFLCWVLSHGDTWPERVQPFSGRLTEIQEKKVQGYV